MEFLNLDKRKHDNDNLLSALAFYILNSISNARNKSMFEGKESIIKDILHEAKFNIQCLD